MVRLLVEAIRHHGEVRAEAAEALGNVGDSRAVVPLIAALREASISWDVQRALLSLLKRIANTLSLEDLRLAAGLKDSEILSEDYVPMGDDWGHWVVTTTKINCTEIRRVAAREITCRGIEI